MFVTENTPALPQASLPVTLVGPGLSAADPQDHIQRIQTNSIATTPIQLHGGRR